MMPILQLAPRLARGWQTHCDKPGDVAITFDDGPDPKTTSQLLRALELFDLKATFFVIGQKCKGNATLLREISAAGHTIACHGYSHERHWFRNSAFVQGSIRQTMYILQDYGIKMAPLFRPPFGAIDWKLHRHIVELNVKPVLWSAHVTDWKQQDVSVLRQKLNSVIHDRMILLLHDGHETTDSVIQVLPHLRDELLKRKLRAITLLDSREQVVAE